MCMCRFVRKCWLTFERGSKVREICFGLNSQKIGDHEIKPVVNKVNYSTCNFQGFIH